MGTYGWTLTLIISKGIWSTTARVKNDLELTSASDYVRTGATSADNRFMRLQIHFIKPEVHALIKSNTKTTTPCILKQLYKSVNVGREGRSYISHDGVTFCVFSSFVVCKRVCLLSLSDRHLIHVFNFILQHKSVKELHGLVEMIAYLRSKRQVQFPLQFVCRSLDRPPILFCPSPPISDGYLVKQNVLNCNCINCWQ